MTFTSVPKRKIEEISSHDDHSQPTSLSRAETTRDSTTTTSVSTVRSQTTTPHLPSPSSTLPSNEATSSSGEDSTDDASSEADSSSHDSSEEDEDEDEEDETAQEDTAPSVPLRNRLAAFLPQLAAANQSLLNEPPDPTRDTGFEILQARDNVVEDRKNDDENEAELGMDGAVAGPYIEMDLDLGILEEKRAKQRRPMKDGIVLPIGQDGHGTSDDHSEELEEESDVEDQAFGGTIEDQPNRDLLSKLKGETANTQRRKIVIEEVT